MAGNCQWYLEDFPRFSKKLLKVSVFVSYFIFSVLKTTNLNRKALEIALQELVTRRMKIFESSQPFFIC